MPLNFRELDVTGLSLAAHKFHGPAGIGALLLRERNELSPRQFGGHQESGRRAGTETVALAVGMAAVLEHWHRDRERQDVKLRELRDRLETGLLSRCDPAVVNGSRPHRISNTLNIAFPGVNGEALLVALDLAGIACSLGTTLRQRINRTGPRPGGDGLSPRNCVGLRPFQPQLREHAWGDRRGGEADRRAREPLATRAVTGGNAELTTANNDRREAR